ncbi:MAG: molybdopterin-synthase adenylyltransferase MoeB [Paracoccaceae bacterium]|nr:molybdopterin-synthase adenylyltransferase MoeB [Paracoccaceae bacterium]
MALVLGLALALWGFGAMIKAPVNARILMIGLLYVAVLALQVAMPPGHPLKEATGGSAGEWLVLGGLGAIVWGYSKGLKSLRKRVRPENKPREQAHDSSVELDRNARHIVLREIGGPGQKRLKQARVLVIGAGGLGSPALQYLAAAGVGTIGIIDDDVVENSNLQRQVIHTDARIGMPKVFSAEAAMIAQNPFVTVRPYNRRLTADIAAELFQDYDLILDGTDDVATRYLVNETAVAAKLPLVSAAISQWEGQISIFDPSRDAPCYACVFPNPAAEGLAPSCAEGGVLGPLPGIIGAMMAAEAVKLLAGAGTPLLGRMLIYDALYAESRVITVKRREDCRVCGAVAL